MRRRGVLAGMAWIGAGGSLWTASAGAQGDAAALLRAGGCAVVLRHAETDPGIGDPPGFQLGQCSTQRNLSESGRAQAKQLGQWFESRGLKPAAVLSSAWCRCKDTADLAFGAHTVFAPLNSTFDARSADQAGQTAALRKRLAGIAGGRFEVWVTHQVNISALSGESTRMGEAVILGAAGKMLTRSSFE
jgi:phosphohistidine phosphatase SixA